MRRLLDEELLMIGDIAKLSPAELLRFPNFGRGCLKKTEAALAQYGIKLQNI